MGNGMSNHFGTSIETADLKLPFKVQIEYIYIYIYIYIYMLNLWCPTSRIFMGY